MEEKKEMKAIDLQQIIQKVVHIFRFLIGFIQKLVEFWTYLIGRG